MATGSRFFQQVELPEQKSYGHGIRFPVVLTSNPTKLITTKEKVLEAFEEAIRDEKPWLESLLRERGVILFRITPSDFNQVVEAFGYPEAFYIGGRASRTQVVGRIYTANESPLDKRIPFHHEMTYVKDFPSKLFFFCEEEPGSGGQTPIVLEDCLKILEEECAIIPWKKGDVMFVNNLTVLHSRQPLLKPPRRILASLCK